LGSDASSYCDHLIAIIAAALGFGGIAGASAGIVQLLFVIFLIALIVSVALHLVQHPAR
jgi:uncharacterized membrane protein YtjA (UPF0391 family)